MRTIDLGAMMLSVEATTLRGKILTLKIIKAVSVRKARDE